MAIAQDGKNVEAVDALPFRVYQIDWIFLKGLEQLHTPMSIYIARKFVAECYDIYIDKARADDLFDQVEILIALSFNYNRLETAIRNTIGRKDPIGRFIWRNHGNLLESELKRIESLNDSDAFFAAGLWGDAELLRRLRSKNSEKSVVEKQTEIDEWMADRS